METGDYYPAEHCPYKTPTRRKSPMKWFIGIVGATIGIAHIGVLGHLINLTGKYADRPQFPSINLPTGGDYSSYDVNVGKDGYSIKYKANDPKVMSSERSLDVDKKKNGWFGGGSEKRSEYRRDEYTINGTRNIGAGGAATDGEGKSAKDVECIVAAAGARSQGAMAGTAISAGVLVPAVMNIPYVGWLAAGWATLLGNKVGSEVGSEVGSIFNDC
jgi:hypothetical protein